MKSNRLTVHDKESNNVTVHDILGKGAVKQYMTDKESKKETVHANQENLTWN